MIWRILVIFIAAAAGAVAYDYLGGDAAYIVRSIVRVVLG